MAQASDGEWKTKGLQENSSPLLQLWKEQKARENQLGDAPIPFGAARGRERRGNGVKDILPDTTKAVQLVK